MSSVEKHSFLTRCMSDRSEGKGDSMATEFGKV